MKKLLLVLLALVLLPALAQADNSVVVKVYSGFTGDPCCTYPGPSGAPYSGFVGSFLSPDINFGPSFHPFAQTNFGADIFGFLGVTSAGSYTFSLNSDDGSHLLIDGNLIIDNGGTHPPTTTLGSVSLTAGVHPFEVQFYECCGDPSQLILALPAGVSYVPEPGVLTLLGSTGLLGIVGSFRKKFTRL
jgi:hypothetical protein